MDNDKSIRLVYDRKVSKEFMEKLEKKYKKIPKSKPYKTARDMVELVLWEAIKDE